MLPTDMIAFKSPRVGALGLWNAKKYVSYEILRIRTGKTHSLPTGEELEDRSSWIHHSRWLQM